MQPVATFMTPPLRKAIYRHVKECWPEEACGIIIGDVYHPCENIHEDPENAFRIDARIVAVAVEENPGKVAIVHSHPKGQRSPTKSDMEGQAAWGVPWIIVPTNDMGTPIEDFQFPVDLGEPLEGLDFRAGVRDCYTHIRKWYFQNRGVTIPEFPRDDQWWLNNEDMYVEGFAKAGFRRLSEDELYQGDLLCPQEGDVALWKMMTQEAINHGAVYTGGNLLTHHLPNRQGRSEPAVRWVRKVEIWLRYAPDEHDPPARTTERDVPEDGEHGSAGCGGSDPGADQSV